MQTQEQANIALATDADTAVDADTDTLATLAVFFVCFDVAFEVLLIMCLTFEFMMRPHSMWSLSECGQLI